MLDQNTISQLSQLKQDIISSKEYAEGVVVGANGRFGFVKLDDGRDAFLNPDKMQRVLPGDRLKVTLVKNAKGQLEAEIESLLSQHLSVFVGQYKVKGSAHFVLPEDRQQTRWIFLPPQQRGKCQENDWVLAEVTRHPFRDGKAAAKLITRIGGPNDDYLQQSLTIARFGLAREWPKDVVNQTQQCAQQTEQTSTERQDLTHLPLVTIDSTSTRDMDDALYVEPIADGGWHLWIGIADPASFITPASPLAKVARTHGQSVYLPGRVLPMLPEALATDTFSLLPEQQRPALVCKVTIAADGAIVDSKFQSAHIKSHGKLNYIAVGQFLDGDASALEDCSEDIKDNLKILKDVADTRQEYRQIHNWIHEEQADYDFILNKQGLIESINKRTRNPAHRVVEEAMLIANLCAGQFLSQHECGLFTTHLGFRPERLGEVKALLHEELGQDENLDQITELDGFLALLRKLRDGEHANLLPPLRRMMQTSELSTEAAPHMSLGFPQYATITSPIRRYADLCNHWSIHQILSQQKAQTVPSKVLEQLRESISRGRQASRQLEQTLTGLYLRKHIGMEGIGIIRIVTQQGFGVRFVDSGIEGFVQFPKGKDKVFDAKRMTLTVAGTLYRLNQEVAVKVRSVDLERRRVKLTLPETAEGEQKTTDTNQSA